MESLVQNLAAMKVFGIMYLLLTVSCIYVHTSRSDNAEKGGWCLQKLLRTYNQMQDECPIILRGSNANARMERCRQIKAYKAAIAFLQRYPICADKNNSLFKSFS